MSAIATTSIYSGIDRADENVAFIAGADDADAEPVIKLRPVAEILGAQPGGSGCSADDANRRQKVAPRCADGFVEILLADFLFFGSQVHRSLLVLILYFSPRRTQRITRRRITR